MEALMIRRSMALLACAAALIGAGAHEAQAQARSGEQGERFVVSGVILYDGGGLAWLQEPSLTSNRAVAVRLSDSIGPYRVTKILDDRVELEGPGGTVLVPVYNGPAGPGSAVAMTGDGSATAATPHASGPGTPASVQQGASPDPAQGSARALRERLDVARRHAQQLQAAGHTVAQQPTSVTAPRATIGPSSGGAAGTTAAPQAGSLPAGGLPTMDAGARGTQSGGQVAAPAPGGSTSDVVIAEKRQTFQQMLGLK
jgi:hypothetical protein